MGLVRLAAPTTLPVSIVEVRQRLRMADETGDAEIARMINAATRHVEQKINRSILQQQWRLVSPYFSPRVQRLGAYDLALVNGSAALLVDSYPAASKTFRENDLVLPLPPLVSVESVKYLDTNGTLQTLSSTNYVVDTGSYFGAIRPAFGKTWPATALDPSAVRVEFTCGNATADVVDSDLIMAILLLVGHYDLNREASSPTKYISTVPMGVDDLLAPYLSPMVV